MGRRCGCARVLIEGRLHDNASPRPSAARIRTGRCRRNTRRAFGLLTGNDWLAWSRFIRWEVIGGFAQACRPGQAPGPCGVCISGADACGTADCAQPRPTIASIESSVTSASKRTRSGFISPPSPASRSTMRSSIRTSKPSTGWVFHRSMPPSSNGRPGILAFRVKERPLITDVTPKAWRVKSTADEMVGAMKLHSGVSSPQLVHASIQALRSVYQSKAISTPLTFRTVPGPITPRSACFT